MRYRRGLSFLFVCSSLASAQGPKAPAHMVTGTVYDSVAGAPLAGAVVQAVFASPDVQVVLTETAPRVFSATTDASGAYRLSGLPAGRFSIGFQHGSLVALGIESPLNTFELAADSAIAVNLAIPSGAAVRVQRCGASARDTTDGMLAGLVFDVAHERPAAGSSVTVEWLELVRNSGKMTGARQRVAAVVSEDGTYVACGVPGDAWVDVRIAQPGYHVIEGHASVPTGGATRLDFRLADSSVAKGTATIRGKVYRTDRAPLVAGRASISALGLEAPIRDGDFSMAGLPAGTWTVEARAIGFEPHSVLVQLTEHANTDAAIIITQKAQTLEAVNVIGKVGRDIRILDGIVERNSIYNGTMFLPGNEYLAHAVYPSDVLRAAKGFSPQSPILTRVRGCADTVSGDKLGKQMDKAGKNSLKPVKTLAVYLDGGRWFNGLPGLLDAVPIGEVLAIETYPDMISVPAMWRTSDACAVMAVWTKR